MNFHYLRSQTGPHNFPFSVIFYAPPKKKLCILKSIWEGERKQIVVHSSSITQLD